MTWETFTFRCRLGRVLEADTARFSVKQTTDSPTAHPLPLIPLLWNPSEERFWFHL